MYSPGIGSWRPGQRSTRRFPPPRPSGIHQRAHVATAGCDALGSPPPEPSHNVPSKHASSERPANTVAFVSRAHAGEWRSRSPPCADHRADLVAAGAMVHTEAPGRRAVRISPHDSPAVLATPACGPDCALLTNHRLPRPGVLRAVLVRFRLDSSASRLLLLLNALVPGPVLLLYGSATRRRLGIIGVTSPRRAIRPGR